jgi:hypothetical protein
VTMTEGMVRPGALSARDGRLAVTVHLPWYRSLPVSCLESVRVTVDGVPAHVRSVATGGYTGRVEDASASDATWDLRDELAVVLDRAARPGDVRAVDVALAIRIPYLQQTPGVALVQRASARTEGVLR